MNFFFELFQNKSPTKQQEKSRDTDESPRESRGHGLVGRSSHLTNKRCSYLMEGDVCAIPYYSYSYRYSFGHIALLHPGSKSNPVRTQKNI